MKCQDGKFGPRTEEGVMIGYGNGKSYRLLKIITKEVFLSQDVTFDEFHTSPKEALHGNTPFIELELDELETEFTAEDFGTVHPPETDNNKEGEPQAENYQQILSPDSNQEINSPDDTIQQHQNRDEDSNFDNITYYPNIRNSTRSSVKNQPARYKLNTNYAPLVTEALVSKRHKDEPLTYEEAVRGKKKIFG